jgi:hypothetical protein
MNPFLVHILMFFSVIVHRKDAGREKIVIMYSRLMHSPVGVIPASEAPACREAGVRNPSEEAGKIPDKPE